MICDWLIDWLLSQISALIKLLGKILVLKKSNDKSVCSVKDNTENIKCYKSQTPSQTMHDWDHGLDSVGLSFT